MTANEVQAFRGKVINAFKPERETLLNQLDPEYVSIYPLESDPILRMRDAVSYDRSGGLQFFSGCRGSGKSTQLNCLRRSLEDDRYTVLYINALEYLSPADPVEASDLLIVLGAALSQAAAPLLGFDPAKQGYFSRFWEYLKLTDVELTEFGLGADLGKFDAEFKGTFRTVDSFRAKLRQHLTARLDNLKNATHKYFDDIASQLAKKQPGRAGFVLIFDQFEQLRGDLTNADKVIESVLRIFTHHLELLHLPGWHVIYTVPPWLHVAHPGCVDLACFLPCIKLWKNTLAGAKPQRDEDGWTKMRALVEQRVGPGELDLLFGPPAADGQRPLLDRLVLYSGGHFRDLFLLVTKCVLAARTLPIQPFHVEDSIANLASSMLISDVDSLILREIHRTHELCLPDRESKTITDRARLLDHHLILEFRNGKPWFDLHPAIVEEVERTAARVEARSKPSGQTG